MPQRHVAHFVRHDARHFAFGLCRLDHAAVDVHRAAGQREGVDVADVDHLERVAEFRMLKFRRNRLSQPRANVRDIRLHLRVGQYRQLFFYLLGRFAARGDVFRNLVLVVRRDDFRLADDEADRRQEHDRGRSRAGDRRVLCGSHHGVYPSLEIRTSNAPIKQLACQRANRLSGAHFRGKRPKTFLDPFRCAEFWTVELPL